MTLFAKLNGYVNFFLRKKELRYLLAGGFSEVLEFVSFVILLFFTNRLYFSNSISFAIGVLSGFVFHKFWSFPGAHQYRTRYQFAGFVGLALFNFLAVNVIVGYLVNSLGVWPPAAKLVAIIIAFSWSYIIVNKVIFRHRTTS